MLPRRLITVLCLVTAASLGQEAAAAAEPIRATVVIKNRKVEGGQRTVTARKGDAVELTFTADEPAELHLHGYDRLVSVRPDAPAVLSLDARIAGRFPLEAHRFGTGQGGRGHTVLLYLEVHPR